MLAANEAIFQVAWVVDDIAAAERRLTATLGVPTWTRLDEVHFGPDTCRYRGEPADFTAHVSFAYAGAQQLELIEPVAGASLYASDLDRHGPGVHHVARLVDDIDAAVEAAIGHGHAVVQDGSFGDGLRFAYLEHAAGGWTHLELMQLSDDMRQFFATLANQPTTPGVTS